MNLKNVSTKKLVEKPASRELVEDIKNDIKTEMKNYNL